MNKRIIIAAAVVLGGLLVALAVVGIYWYDAAVSHRNGIIAQHQDNQNRYDNFWKSVKETGQVSDRYKEGFKEILLGAIEGRYKNRGGGTKACANYIKEHNPALSETSYLKLQNLIESGRADFTRSQTELLDKQRAYRNHLESFSGAGFAAVFGFPKPVEGELKPGVDLDGDGLLTVLDYRVVTSSHTQKAFETGRDDKEIQVFKD